MKVLLVAERYWPEVGAAPTRLANMAEGLKKRGCDVDVLTGLPNYPKGQIYDGYRGLVSRHEVHEGIDVFRYWIYATVSRKPIARILNMFSLAVTIWLFAFKRKRIKGYDAVIIQTPTLVVAASAVLLFKKLYGIKCILNVSDIWPLTAADMGAILPYTRSYKFMLACERFIYKASDGVIGQSEEILNHVAQEMIALGCSECTESICGEPDSDEVLHSKLWATDSRLFLYRNLHISDIAFDKRKRNEKPKIVFCGMLGVAQNVAGIVENVPFRDLGVEFHIIGGGKQLEEIEQWCSTHPDCNVFTHGYMPKEQVSDSIRGYDASIIPLTARIRGAVPSKLYDTLPCGLPILFCGGGEGALFVERYNVGLTSNPGDYRMLIENIKRLRDMSEDEYEAISSQCIQVSESELNFDRQMVALTEWLSSSIFM